VGFVSVPAIWFGGSLFVGAVLFAGCTTPGYSHLRQSISELGASNATNGRLVRWVGFVPLGLSFMVFAHQSDGRFSNHVPFVFFVMTGLILFLAGIFPTDPDNRRDTLTGKVHAIAVIALLVLLSAAPFAFALSVLYREPPMDWFPIFSFLMGMLVLALLLLSTNAADSRQASRFLSIWFSSPGLNQRIFVLLHCVWWLVFSRFVAMP
jgi:hypothetical membrane protein